MGITFQSYTQAAGSYPGGYGPTSLSPSLPANQSGDVMIAVINVLNQDFNGHPTVTAPGGWTLLGDNGSFGIDVRRAAYRHDGDGSSGTAVWGFDVPIRGNIEILCYREINTTTPIDVTASFHNDTSISTNHIANGITTVTANAVLIGCFFSIDTGISFTDAPSSLSNVRVSLAGTTGSAERPTLICDGIQAVAGASGNKTAITNSGTQGQEILIALRPAPNPTVPTLLFPNGGQTLTAGAVVNVTWQASTSPTAAQNTLKYNLDYSANNGGSWTSIIALTTAGVTTYPWTVPSTTGNGYLVRIRANDPALSIYSLAYDQSDSAFSVVAETTPGQPTITTPAVGSVNNKAVNVTVAWNHQGGVGNPQVAFTLQWANNAAFTSPTTVGPTTTGTQSTSIDFSAQTSGTTIYVKVKTQGVSLYSAYSNIVSFTVASLPATPNITAPTAGSPPTTPLPTIAFTEADPFVSRKMRITIGGIEAYNSGDVPNTTLSFTSPYTFANGVAVALYLSVKNSYGLASAEDTETVTPAYTGPATPTLTIQAINSGGYVLAQIANSDTPTYDELWRFEYTAGRATAIRVGASLPKNVSFTDYNARSGTVYQYFARAYNGTGLFTDSADSAVIYLTLTDTFIHVVSRTSTSGNAILPTTFLLLDGSEFGLEEVAASHKLLGRSRPVSISGPAVWQTARVIGIDPHDKTIPSRIVPALMTIWRQGVVVCLRSGAGHRIFGKMTEPGSSISSESMNVDAFSFGVTEEDYTEGL